jgi:hypothetical protein
MKNRKVSSYKELELAIAELKENKAKHEEVLKQNMGDIKEALKPVNIIKNTLKNVIEDKTIRQDALKAGLLVGIEFAIERLFKRNKKSDEPSSQSILGKLVSNFIK